MTAAPDSPGPARPSLPSTALELHSGLVTGLRPDPYPVPVWGDRAADPAADPRAALEQAVLRHLAAGPVTVQFSGGRDSSLVLAVAVHVARREGLPLPEVVTERYAGVPTADEQEWQELVATHLDVELQIITVPAGSSEVLAPLAISRLRRDGPLWPPPVGLGLGRLGPLVGGRTLLTGESGDEILGPTRISRWVQTKRWRKRPGLAPARLMAEDLLPLRARTAVARRQNLRSPLCPWLRPAAQAELVEGLAADAAAQPWDWRDAHWKLLNMRLPTMLQSSMAVVAEREGFRIAHPLVDPGFVEALCRRGGRAGLTSRTQAMAVLAKDILPRATISRPTKATFNNVYAADRVRAFAREWDGSGVDHALVDVTALRTAWQAEFIVGPSLMPLMLAAQHALSQGWEPALETGS